MARVRATNNKAEIKLRKLLWNLGFRYRLYDQRLPGRPDIVLPRHRTAIFVDGDFWHGRVLIEHGPDALRSSFRTERRAFWIDKITRNVARDRQNDSDLKELGWTVLRYWERDILKDPARIIREITDSLQSPVESRPR